MVGGETTQRAVVNHGHIAERNGEQHLHARVYNGICTALLLSVSTPCADGCASHDVHISIDITRAYTTTILLCSQASSPSAKLRPPAQHELQAWTRRHHIHAPSVRSHHPATTITRAKSPDKYKKHWISLNIRRLWSAKKTRCHTAS